MKREVDCQHLAYACGQQGANWDYACLDCGHRWLEAIPENSPAHPDNLRKAAEKIAAQRLGPNSFE